MDLSVTIGIYQELSDFITFFGKMESIVTLNSWNWRWFENSRNRWFRPFHSSQWL